MSGVRRPASARREPGSIRELQPEQETAATIAGERLRKTATQLKASGWMRVDVLMYSLFNQVESNGIAEVLKKETYILHYICDFLSNKEQLCWARCCLCSWVQVARCGSMHDQVDSQGIELCDLCEPGILW